MSLDTYLEESRLYRKLLEDIRKQHPNHTIAIYDTLPDLCDFSDSICTIHKNGRFLYGMTDHVSEFAATLIGKNINDYLNNQK
jgi:hypothetical protein